MVRIDGQLAKRGKSPGGQCTPEKRVPVFFGGPRGKRGRKKSGEGSVKKGVKFEKGGLTYKEGGGGGGKVGGYMEPQWATVANKKHVSGFLGGGGEKGEGGGS